MRAFNKIISWMPFGKALLNRRQTARAIRSIRKEGAAKGVRIYRQGDKLVFQKQEKLLAISCAQMIYAHDMIVDFDSFYGAVLAEPLAAGHIVDYSKPRWHRLKETGKRVYLTSFSEGDALTRLYLKYAAIGAGGVVIDLGANCGIAALSFSAAVGSAGRVISLEPDAANFEALVKNLAENGAQNVHPMPVGIWSQSGQISFDADGTMGALAVTSPNHLPRGKIGKIPVISLLDLAEKFQLVKVDLVKMDIEGSEFEVIPTAIEFMNRFKPRWIVEVHDNARIDKLASIFQSVGYFTGIINQSDSHNFPLLVAIPKAR